MSQDASKPEQPTTAEPPFKWNAKRHGVARDCAEDELVDQEIADAAGITRETLRQWKKHPDFAARVAELVEEAGEAARRHAIGRKFRRVRSMNQRWLKLQAVIDARAADPDHQALPGGGTGLLVRRVRVIGTGEHQQTVIDSEVDVGLLKELRELELAAARELNQLDLPNKPPPQPDDLAPFYDLEDGE